MPFRSPKRAPFSMHYAGRNFIRQINETAAKTTEEADPAQGWQNLPFGFTNIGEIVYRIR